MRRRLLAKLSLAALVGSLLVVAGPQHVAAAECPALSGMTPTLTYPTHTPVGTTAAITAGLPDSGCTWASPPLFQFWQFSPETSAAYMVAPGAGGYHIVQEYSASRTFSFTVSTDPDGLGMGDYRFALRVKASNSPNAWDTFRVGGVITETYCSPGSFMTATVPCTPCPQAGTGFNQQGCFTSHSGPSGNVIVHPVVALVFWGSAWNTGWTDPTINGVPNQFGFGNASYKSYLETFFNNIANNPWSNIYGSRYCMTSNGNLPTGSTTCPANATFIGNAPVTGATNPANTVLSAEYYDFSTEPGSRTVDAEAVAVQSALVSVGLWSPNTIIYIVPPPSFGSCGSGYHGGAMVSGQLVSYAYQVSGVGVNTCRNANVRPPAPVDAFGHNYYDDVSIVASHEFAEAATDPTITSGSPGCTLSTACSLGWYQDRPPQWEIGDICYLGYYDIVNAGNSTTFMAVQQLISNDSWCTNW